MDQLYLMTVFIAVGEEQSLAIAARRLNLSPEAVARAVCALEAQLGNKLLLRTPRSVQLTEDGRRYLEGLRRIMAKLAEADQAATEIKLRREGRLRVTACPMLGRGFVIPCIVDYMHRFPDVEVWGYFSDRTVNLVDEGIDVAVRVGQLVDSRLKSMRVGRLRRLLCASPAYLARRGVPEHPADLRQHTIIATTAMASRSEMKSGLYDAGPNNKTRLRLTVTSHEAAIDAAVAGLGITCLLLSHVAPLLDNGCLVPVLAAHEAPPLPVQVVHREGKNGSSKVRDFIDLLVARLRADGSLN
jgi:DNA-binding transcriptional LysR family regulator